MLARRHGGTSLGRSAAAGTRSSSVIELMQARTREDVLESLDDTVVKLLLADWLSTAQNAY